MYISFFFFLFSIHNSKIFYYEKNLNFSFGGFYGKFCGKPSECKSKKQIYSEQVRVEKMVTTYEPTYRINCRNGDYAVVTASFNSAVGIADSFCGSGKWQMVGYTEIAKQ